MNNLKKIIEYGLYLLVFLLPLQTRWIIKAGELNGGYWEYGTISLYATDILLFVLLVLFIITIFKKQIVTSYPFRRSESEASELRVTSFWWLIGLMELAILISIFFAPNKLLAVFSYIRFLLGVGLFWLVISAEYNKAKLIWSLIVGAVFHAGLGIWQFISQTSFSFKWLGIADHKAYELGTSVVETLSSDGLWQRWLRAYGGLDHPNILGGFLAVVLLLLILMSLRGATKSSDEAIPAKRANRDCFASLATTFNVFLFFCFIVLLTALFFTFSRGAWAGLIIGLLAIFFILLWRKDGAGQKKLLEITGIGAIIILILFNLYGDLVLTRLSKDTRLEIKSNMERIESYKYAKEIIKKHWLFGVGIGNYTLALKDEIKSDQPSYFYQPVHNTFLLIWSEAGIFGLIGFIGLICLIINYQLSIINKFSKFKIIENCKLKIVNSEQEYRNKAVSKNFVLSLPILLTFIIMMLVDHWFFSIHFGVLFIWLVFGIILKEENPNKYHGN